MLSIKTQVFKLKGYNSILLLILLILILPDDIFHLTSAYTFQTPDYINYKWLNVSISYIFLPFVILSIIITVKSCRKNWLLFYSFFFSLLMWNLFRHFFLGSQLFSEGYFELFYGSFIGFILFIIVDYYTNSKLTLENFFEVFMNVQIFGLFLSVILNMGSKGRYHPPNLDTGTTGLFLGIYLVYWLFVKKSKSFLIIFFFVFSILLTGSRSNLIFPLFFIFLYSLNRIKSTVSIKKIKLLTISGLLAIISTFLFIVNIQYFLSSQVIERLNSMVDLLNTRGELTNDRSLSGRVDSILVGFEVLKQNPFGIFFSFTDVQLAMTQLGYPTFPHSSVLFFYLAMGPLFIILCLYFIYLFIKSVRSRSGYSWILFYLVLYSLFFGGAVVNFKIYFFYFLIFGILINNLKNEKNSSSL